MRNANLRWRNAALLAGVGIAAVSARFGHVPFGGDSAAAFAGAGGRGQIQIRTTPEDFFQPGSQPLGGLGTETVPVQAASRCTFCHADYLEDQNLFVEPGDAWRSSIKAQSARDPVWRTALAIANQDAKDAGEYCIRCHSPGAWLGGRSLPADGSAFVEGHYINDFDGVVCHFCHRVVNPVLEADSPPEDADILAGLTFPPGTKRGNGRYVIDPNDVRRGPFDDVPLNMHGVPIIPSAFHKKSEMCESCHDVANPVFSRGFDGRYVLNANDEPHPTQEPYEMFPEQRTYSEWLNSDFNRSGVLFPDGRFGGNHPTGVMSSCQDCHMPDQFTGGCFAWESEPFFARPDMPLHSFAGANKWVLNAVRSLYDDSRTGLSTESIAAAHARTDAMLRAASDMQVGQVGADIQVRVINYSGHKLPTGYPEGRRMWLNVQFRDGQGGLVAERGAYDYDTGELTASDTKVYHARVGIRDDVAAATNLPAGPSFHLVLANVILLDNRIPPMGFRNSAFAAFGGSPVGYAYADGQHWDDTFFDIPAGAVRAVVTLNYQSMTKEYIEFLRDAVVTGDEGRAVYDAWADPTVGNKAPPIDMDVVTIDLAPPVIGDVNGDGSVNFADVLDVLFAWGGCSPPDLCPTDIDGNEITGLSDLLLVLANWS